jgi:hypothetical protein
MNDHDRLRQYLNEEVPPGGSDADTLFTNAQIDDMLAMRPAGARRDIGLWAAAAEGWERKASKYVDLVNNQTGGTQRQLSDLHEHATKQADRYRKLAISARAARSGKIVRKGTMIR